MSEFKWLKDSLEKLETKIEKIDQRLDDQAITLAKNTTILEEHIRRTDLAEMHIEIHQQEHQEQIEKIENKLTAELEPVKKHVDRMQFVGSVIWSILLYIGTPGAFVALVSAIIKHFTSHS